MDTVKSFLDHVRRHADELPLELRDPLPDAEVGSVAANFLSTFGVPLPEEYLALLRVTDGIEAGMGYIASAETLMEQNQEVWFDHYVTDADGLWEGIACKGPTYIWLGFEGNSAEQIFDLASHEYQQVPLDTARQPFYRGPSLVGLLRRLIYGSGAAG